MIARAAVCAAAMVGGAGAAGEPSVAPLVLLAAADDGRPLADGDRRVRGCGLRAVYPHGPVVEVLNLRDGDATVMRLTLTDPAAPPGPGGAVSLATAGENTAPWLAAEAPSADGVLAARGTVDPDAGARLFQQLMVGGGTVLVNLPGAVHRLSIPGPVGPGVRAAYLNCAGDLFPRTR